MTGELDKELQTLENEAVRSGPGAAAQVLNMAGDLCLGAGQVERGLTYYGRAIDASLLARRYNAAAGLCRKVLRVVPSAIRTRCTLAWLALGRGDAHETTREIAAYVASITGEVPRALAVAHLRMMAETTPVAAIRSAIADHLDALGQAGAAQAIRQSIPSDAPVHALSAAQQEELWGRVVGAATLGPSELPM
jgi:hypothetical protein